MEEDNVPPENKIARDPPVTTQKSRPGSKRKKGGLELQKPKQTTCGVCHELGHDARTCPVRLANPEQFSLLGLFV